MEPSHLELGVPDLFAGTPTFISGALQPSSTATLRNWTSLLSLPGHRVTLQLYTATHCVGDMYATPKIISSILAPPVDIYWLCH